jgi:hypothetical protein
VRFVRNVFIVWLLMIVLCSGALLYGRASNQSNELQDLGFGVCDGDPCFMGIVPGKTSWDEAKLILKPYNIKQDFEDAADANVKDFRLIVYSSKGIINELIIQKDSSYGGLGVSLGSVIQQVGTPCAAIADPRAANIFYPSMSLYFARDGDRLRKETGISALSIMSKDIVLYCTNNKYHWKGFTLMNHYGAYN